jgi:hypothetical protein
MDQQSSFFRSFSTPSSSAPTTPINTAGGHSSFFAHSQPTTGMSATFQTQQQLQLQQQQQQLLLLQQQQQQLQQQLQQQQQLDLFSHDFASVGAYATHQQQFNNSTNNNSTNNNNNNASLSFLSGDITPSTMANLLNSQPLDSMQVGSSSLLSSTTSAPSMASTPMMHNTMDLMGSAPTTSTTTMATATTTSGSGNAQGSSKRKRTQYDPSIDTTSLTSSSAFGSNDDFSLLSPMDMATYFSYIESSKASSTTAAHDASLNREDPLYEQNAQYVSVRLAEMSTLLASYNEQIPMFRAEQRALSVPPPALTFDMLDQNYRSMLSNLEQCKADLDTIMSSILLSPQHLAGVNNIRTELEIVHAVVTLFQGELLYLRQPKAQAKW